MLNERQKQGQGEKDRRFTEKDEHRTSNAQHRMLNERQKQGQGEKDRRFTEKDEH
jgi:hypothetical protein